MNELKGYEPGRFELNLELNTELNMELNIELNMQLNIQLYMPKVEKIFNLELTSDRFL